jgi:metal-dependent amidase/aminoacylase/carboxypeptidase family protein
MPIPALVSAFENNLEALGLTVEKVKPPFRLGSSDFGNVSQATPALMGFISIAPKGTPTHSRSFADAAISSQGQEGCIQAVKAMALTAIDVLCDPLLLHRIKQQFQSAQNMGRAS